MRILSISFVLLLAAALLYPQDVTVIRKKRTAAASLAFKGGWAWSNVDEAAACASPCTITLAQSAAVGDTIAIIAVTSFDNFGCSDSGSNTYTLDQQGNNAALCTAVNVSNTASTVTITATAFGSGIIAAARVISGATAQDGSTQWTAPAGTAFDTGSVTASANGLAVGATTSTASNPKPISFDSPWDASSTRANANGWVLSVTSATTTNGGARALGGDSTTNAVARAVMAAFK